MTRKILRKLSLFIIISLLAAGCSANNQIPEQNGNTATSAPTASNENNSLTPSPDPSATPDATVTPEPEPEKKEPVKVKAVYVTGTVAGSKRLDEFIELVNSTELNSLVIDIKEGGMVNYDSQVPLVKELGLSKKNFNVEEVLKKCHENNIHVVGRIVVFRDNGLATKKKRIGH